MQPQAITFTRSSPAFFRLRFTRELDHPGQPGSEIFTVARRLAVDQSSATAMPSAKPGTDIIYVPHDRSY